MTFLSDWFSHQLKHDSWAPIQSGAAFVFSTAVVGKPWVRFVSATQFAQLLICHKLYMWFPLRGGFSVTIRQLFVVSALMHIAEWWFHMLSIKFPFQRRHEDSWHFKVGLVNSIFSGLSHTWGGKWSRSLHYWLISRTQLQAPQNGLSLILTLLYYSILRLGVNSSSKGIRAIQTRHSAHHILEI